jgi:hypothetical protein
MNQRLVERNISIFQGGKSTKQETSLLAGA